MFRKHIKPQYILILVAEYTELRETWLCSIMFRHGPKEVMAYKTDMHKFISSFSPGT